MPASPRTYTPARLRNRPSSSSLRHESTFPDEQAAQPAPETPVSRFKAKQLAPSAPSPRRVRKQSWAQKVNDLPSNLLLSLETYLASLTFDELGYPIGISLNALHFLLRLPSLFRDTSTWLSRATSWRDVDKRLKAIQEAQAMRQSTWITWLSVLLIVLSCVNTVYLFTRKRPYHLVLRPDPIASPNAVTEELDFTHTHSFKPWTQRAKERILNFILRRQPEPPRRYPITRLDVWTPDYVEWSLRCFVLYSPPIALLYHFLTPSTLIPALLLGTIVTLQTFVVSKTYAQLVADRQTISGEVMHEYNVRFVNPRLSVIKKDASVMTNEAEMIDRDELLGTPYQPASAKHTPSSARAKASRRMMH